MAHACIESIECIVTKPHRDNNIRYASHMWTLYCIIVVTQTNEHIFAKSIPFPLWLFCCKCTTAHTHTLASKRGHRRATGNRELFACNEKSIHIQYDSVDGQRMTMGKSTHNCVRQCAHGIKEKRYISFVLHRRWSRMLDATFCHHKYGFLSLRRVWKGTGGGEEIFVFILIPLSMKQKWQPNRTAHSQTFKQDRQKPFLLLAK